MQNVGERRSDELKRFLSQLGVEGLYTISDLSLIDEALTHTSARLNKNHERLEFLGDAVLRLACSEYIDSEHPDLPVGKRSELRAQLVSDQWLAELGASIEIETILLTGTHARRDNNARHTLRAEAAEALIGALYLQPNGLEQVHAWLTPHWKQRSMAVLARPDLFNSKSALQEWSQAQKLGLPSYETGEHNLHHGDPCRFRSCVRIGNLITSEGLGRSRKEAEQQAAQAALQALKEL